MKLTIIKENPEALMKRLRAVQKLKDTKVKVGLPGSAGGWLRLILAVQEPMLLQEPEGSLWREKRISRSGCAEEKEPHPVRRGAITESPAVRIHSGR